VFNISGRKQEVIKLTEQLIAAITSNDYDAYSLVLVFTPITTVFQMDNGPF